MAVSSAHTLRNASTKLIGNNKTKVSFISAGNSINHKQRQLRKTISTHVTEHPNLLLQYFKIRQQVPLKT